MLLLLPAAAVAAGPVSLEEATVIAPQRLGGPLYLSGELHNHGAGIAEGRLEFQVKNGRETIAVVESGPKVLMEGITRFRQVLPMLPTSDGSFGITEVVVHFVYDAGRELLREIPFQLAGRIDSHRVLLQVRAKEDSQMEITRMRELLDLAQVEMIIGKQGFYSPTLMADELPEQSLAYCAFDGVTVTSAGFAQMSGRQLDALAEWIRAGGSACVHIEDGDYFKSKHREFLNTLFQNEESPPWLLDEQGHLIRGGDQWIYAASRAGVGFAIVTRKMPKWHSPDWRRAFARFWHFGRRRREFLVGQGGLDGRKMMLGQQMAGNPRRVGAFIAAGAAGIVPPIGRKIFQVLRPDDIHLLPGWALVGILAFYVILIGPVDYLLLGWLKKRRWTWLVFPLVTVLITAGLIVTANAFMATTMKPRTLTIIDCDAAGKPVRVNTLQFLFENNSREIIFRGEGETFSRLNSDYFRQVALGVMVPPAGVRMLPPANAPVANNPWEQSTIRNDAPTGPYRGTFPGRYTVSQRVGKWTPQVNRMMTFAPSIDMPEINREKASQPETRVLELPDGRTARVFHVAGEEREESQQAIFRNRPVPIAGGGVTRAMVPVTVSGAVAHMASQNLVELVTFRAPNRPARSPLGLGWLDDLPLVDPADPNSRATVVKTVDQDGSITLYRKYQ